MKHINGVLTKEMFDKTTKKVLQHYDSQRRCKMGKTIILDPGHGLTIGGEYQRPLMNCNGKRVRAVYNSMTPHPNDYKKGFYREDFGTLAIAQQAKIILEKQGHTVFLTREDERDAKNFLSSQSTNTWKRKYWKKWKWVKHFTAQKEADVFVSIHTNAGRGTGTSCFWAHSPNGVELSKSLVGALNKHVGLKIRKVAKHRYLILRDSCNGRAVLLECLFHDSMVDVVNLLSKKGVKKVAKGVAYGIDNYCKTF